MADTSVGGIYGRLRSDWVAALRSGWNRMPPQPFERLGDRTMHAYLMGVALGLGLLATGVTAAGGEIYGTVETRDGRRLTGTVRWDHNEVFWNDLLDGHRPADEAEVRKRRGFDLSFFGFRPFEEASVKLGASLAVPFGHLRALEVLDSGRVRLTLKPSRSIELQPGGSSDLGHALREIVIESVEGRHTIDWDGLRRVEFQPSPPGPGRDAARLYGTVEAGTRKLTGYITWDADEALAEDILDGHDSDGEHEIPMGAIVSIERVPGGSRVVLKDRTVRTLGGTNDVDRGHRGVRVVVPTMGHVDVPWTAFGKVTLAPAPPSPSYESFDGGVAWSGKVRLKDGREVQGRIGWRQQDRYTWESIEGRLDGLSHAVQLENVKRLRHHSADTVSVLLRDGTAFDLQLEGSLREGIVVQRREGGSETVAWTAIDTIESL